MILRLLEVWKSGLIIARMSFAILRHNKVKNSTKGAAISHNHRLGDGDKVNIDKAQKHLNRCFFGDGAMARIDAKLPTKLRKDAVVSVELLLTSGPEFFDGIEPDREKLAKNPVFLSWVAKSIQWAKKEFGDNLVDATLHMDESSPHIHVLTVPLTKDGRLCAKEITARTEMQRRQTGYAEVMKPFGLKRGEPATETKRRHIGLKEEAGSGGRASQLAAQVVQKQTELDRVQLDIGSEKANWVMREEFLKARNEKIRGALLEANQKVGKMEKEIVEKDAELVDVKAKFAAMAIAYQAHVDAGLPAIEFLPGEVSPEASKTTQEEFLTEWQAIGKANALDAKHGTPVADSGRLVVLHVGRGKHVMHEVPEGQDIPKLGQTEKSKKGLER